MSDFDLNDQLCLKWAALLQMGNAQQIYAYTSPGDDHLLAKIFLSILKLSHRGPHDQGKESAMDKCPWLVNNAQNVLSLVEFGHLDLKTIIDGEF